MHGLWNMIAKSMSSLILLYFLKHWKQSCIGKNLVESLLYKCNFICSQVQWISLHWISSAVHLSSIFPGGSSSMAAFFGWCVSLALSPSVNALSSQNGFTPHVLRDGGCSPFYPLFNGKICASDISKNWASAIEDGLCRRMNRWMSERKRKKARGKDWLCWWWSNPLWLLLWVWMEPAMLQAPP